MRGKGPVQILFWAVSEPSNGWRPVGDTGFTLFDYAFEAAKKHSAEVVSEFKKRIQANKRLADPDEFKYEHPGAFMDAKIDRP
jgi:hypothetical protein